MQSNWNWPPLLIHYCKQLGQLCNYFSEMEKAQESSDDKQRRTYKIKQSFKKYSWSSCKYIVQLYLSWSLHGTIPAQHSVTKWFLYMEKLDWNLKKIFKYISNLFEKSKQSCCYQTMARHQNTMALIHQTKNRKNSNEFY